jgi:hypothetical protein
MGAAIVDHPEHPRSRGVGLAGHHLLDQPAERRDAGGGLATAEQPGAVHVPGHQVGQRAAALVLVLDPHRPGVGWRPGWVAAAAGLDRGLLVGRDDELVCSQPLARKPALVQVKHHPRLGGEVRARGKIHDRCRQGLRASSSSHRHTVLTLTCSTSPQVMASWRTSAMLKRLNGTARRAGSSQAIALTSAMTAGGKGPRPAWAVPVAKSRQALLGEAFAPLGRGVRRDAQALGDLLVLFTLRGREHDPGP